MSEEAKLRAKYGGALPRQQNMLTKKLMNKVSNNSFVHELSLSVRIVFDYVSRSILILVIIMLLKRKES